MQITRFIPVGCFLLAATVAYLIYQFAFPWAAGSSIVLLTVGLLLILGLHLWTPKLDPLDHFVSQYSLEEPYGTYMRIAFYLIAVATFNLDFLLHHVGMIRFMQYAVFVAGTFSAFMGVFSQKSATIDDVKNTEFEGNAHSLSATLSFGAAIVSMLVFACYPPATVIQKMEWFRGVALTLFSVTLLALFIQIILGWRKIRLAQLHTGKSAAGIITHDVQRRMTAAAKTFSSSAPVPPTLPSKDNSLELKGSLQKANQGLGLSERILIFLFLEWELMLSAIVFILLRA